MPENPRLSRERKVFGLRSTHRPQRDHRVSGTVIVEDGAIAVCYISFAEEFVQALGRIMDRGVSIDDPANLRVIHRPSGDWEVYAEYTRSLNKGKVLLWVSPDKPSWIRGRKTFATY